MENIFFPVSGIDFKKLKMGPELRKMENRKSRILLFMVLFYILFQLSFFYRLDSIDD